jgi:hypothetical protein
MAQRRRAPLSLGRFTQLLQCLLVAAALRPVRASAIKLRLGRAQFALQAPLVAREALLQ